MHADQWKVYRACYCSGIKVDLSLQSVHALSKYFEEN